MSALAADLLFIKSLPQTKWKQQPTAKSSIGLLPATSCRQPKSHNGSEHTNPTVTQTCVMHSENCSLNAALVLLKMARCIILLMSVVCNCVECATCLQGQRAVLHTAGFITPTLFKPLTLTVYHTLTVSLTHTYCLSHRLTVSDTHGLSLRIV